jgi:iron(III) transport system substrate-binding protein
LTIYSRTGRSTAMCLVALAALVTAGCGNSKSSSIHPAAAVTSSGSGSTAFDQIVASAKTEGTVTLYTPVQQTIVDGWTAGFAKAYPGIKLSVFRASAGEVIAKLTAEQKSGTKGADLVIFPAGALAAFDKKGALVPLASPHLKDADMAKAVEDPDRFFVYATVFGWAWNTDLLPKGIHSWTDFLGSNLSGGKVGVWDPSIAPTIPSFYAANAAGSGDPAYLKKLGAQRPRIYPSSEAMENAVVSGEVAATMFASPRVNKLKADGAPIGYAVPTGGTAVAVLDAGVLKSAVHPNAAQVFADWLASVDGQKPVEVSGIPARSNVPGSAIDFATLKPSLPVPPAAQAAFVDLFNKEFHK